MSAANNLKSDHITFFSLCYFLSFSFSFIFLSCCNSCSRYVYMNATHLPLTWTLLYMLSFSFFAFHKKKADDKAESIFEREKSFSHNFNVCSYNEYEYVDTWRKIVHSMRENLHSVLNWCQGMTTNKFLLTHKLYFNERLLR